MNHDDLSCLPFRRQFFLGSHAVGRQFSRQQPSEEGWNVIPLAEDLSAVVQRDLSACALTTGDTTLAVFGEIIDPTNPSDTNKDILHRCMASKTVVQLLSLIESFGGRWALYFRNSESEIVMNDPCGLRQLCYALTHDGLVVGSTPQLIRRAVSLRALDDGAYAQYRESKLYARKENAGLGAVTGFESCWRLLPNHFLSLATATAQRFFPSKPRRELHTKDVAPDVLDLLRGTMAGILARASARMPITAGYDSRVLLAAARPYVGRLTLYIDRMGILGRDHVDVRTPTRMLQKNGLRFSVRNSRDDPDSDFIRCIQQSVGEYRNLPKMRMIYAAHKSKDRDWVINGNGAEIARNFFDREGKIEATAVSAEVLAAKFGNRRDPFILREVEAWSRTLHESGVYGYHPLDLFYWEQRMGNWGSRFPAEQDIVAEEMSPFNNRRVILHLLSTEREARTAPDYTLSRALIEHGWPELLDYPFNELTRFDRLKASVLRGMFRS